MSQTSDGSLVSKTRRGDTDAFGELVQRYQHSVFNVCYRMLGERRDAEDLAQETFLRAYQRLSSYDDTRPFGPWIHRVAANLCLNYIKSQKPVAMVLDEERDNPKEEIEGMPEYQQEHAEKANMIRNAILELRPQYRAAIELRHYQDLSYKEIASQLNLPLSDVKSHLFRARKQLAQELNLT